MLRPLPRKKKLIYIVPLKDSKHPKSFKIKDLYQTGTLCRIEQIKEQSSGAYQLMLTSLKRISFENFTKDADGVVRGVGSPIYYDYDLDNEALEPLASHIKKNAIELIETHKPSASKRIKELFEELDTAELLINITASHADFKAHQKVQLLKNVSLKESLFLLIDLLESFKSSLEVQEELSKRLNKSMDKKQKEIILREQLQAITDELSEMDEEGEEARYDERISNSKMPKTVKTEALKEARRLERTPSMSPEHPTIRNYLDTLLDLPWTKTREKKIDLEKAQQLLDQEHYGLKKVKDRIMQHLAVMSLKKDHKGSVLLFVGPPGVGKTSLGQSIAKAMNRKFVKASLGGVKDESDIRGHRRTYVGAMPGRVIQGIKRVNSRNPVFLLDEIDKLGRGGWNGDPTSAMLEVLDPEQNHAFEDHYLDVPYDLSETMFIATANSLGDIPGPLRDRMEVIQLSAYTLEEKRHIALNHLWQKQLDAHGIKKTQLELDTDILEVIIESYTKEAGVRDLKRKLASVCRYFAAKVIKEPKKCHSVSEDDLEDIFGPKIFKPELIIKDLPIGVATGLAWTPLGGDVLFIESKAMSGKGKLVVTGQLGDVMKESVQIAMSHIRSHLNQINPNFDYEATDIHIHVPHGAIPKDGPSAGVTMLSSLASLISGKPINPKLAMSGEITLRGSVLPVGGIKEKVLAASRAGCNHIILSAENEKDLWEVDNEIKAKLKFTFVENVEQLLEKVLEIKFDLADSFISYSQSLIPSTH